MRPPRLTVVSGAFPPINPRNSPPRPLHPDYLCDANTNKIRSQQQESTPQATFSFIKADGHLIADNARCGVGGSVADDGVALRASRRLARRLVASVLHRPTISVQVTDVAVDVRLSVSLLVCGNNARDW